MTIREIYQKYQVPPNLQQHMLRVTGMANVIATNWVGDNLDVKMLLSACLTHDLANILKFDLVNKINFLGEEAKNVDHWRKVKAEMVQKYGPDEHLATAKICREIGLNEKSLWIVENWGFGNFEKVLKSNNWEYKIGVYSDHRIGPFGIISLVDRFAEQRKRYELQKHNSVDLSAHLSSKSEMLGKCAFEVEKQLQLKTRQELITVAGQNIEANHGQFLEVEI